MTAYAVTWLCSLMSNTAKTTHTADRLLKPEDVMGRFNYGDRKSFLDFVHAAGVPHLRFNSRVFRFEQPAVEAWISRRRVGSTTTQHAA